MRKCLGCNTDLIKKNKFCSNACQQTYQTNLLIERWLGGENITRKGGTSIPNWMRRYLLEEANHKCSECGWGCVNPYTNSVPLDIDHIDGDAYNNRKDNLRVLCPNCHSLKKTFKNTGRRKSTRKYRIESKGVLQMPHPKKCGKGRRKVGSKKRRNRRKNRKN